MKRMLFTGAAILFGFVSLSTAAGDDSISGVVTGVDVDRGTVTILDDRSGVRRTYFLTDRTRILSGDSEIKLADIRRGMAATARYTDTDTGREVAMVEIPSLTEIRNITPIDTAREEPISGEVTGVRRSARTVTILEDNTGTRRTLHVADTARIVRDGKSIELRDLKRGNLVTAQYRQTPAGPVLVTAAQTAPEPEFMASEPEVVAAVQMDELPGTAGTQFWYLLAGLGMLLCAAVLRIARVRHS